MQGIIDKLLILFFGLVLYFTIPSFTLPVILFLCTFIVLTLDELFSVPSFSRGLFYISLLFGCFLPSILFFLPVLSYPLCEKKRTPVLLLAPLPLVFSGLFRQAPVTGFSILLLLFLSLFLADSRRQLAKTYHDFISLRDTDKEAQLSLQEKAHALMEQQDARLKIATLQERTRIAREIHDNVGHLLSRSLLQVGAMLTVKREDEALLLLKDSLDAAMQGIRDSVHDLRDDALDLEASAKQLLSGYSAYQTYLEYDIAPKPPASVTYCFLAITKEALANITKHSNGNTIRISMREYTCLYRLSISDNGTNATLPAETTGMGLENMRTRAAALQGAIRFSTRNGFHIFVSVPKEHH